MAKGATIRGTWVEQIIAETYIEHPTWLNKEIWRAVLVKVREKIEKELSERDLEMTAAAKWKLNDLLKLDWPGLSAVEKLLGEYRKEDKGGAKAIDAPWYVGTKTDYEIPPEVLPTVLKMAVHFQQDKGRPITIREAKWVARLSALKDWRKLSKFVTEYANMEKARELIGGGGSDRLEPVVDSELYTALTGKLPNEPVFDELSGNELPSASSQLILEGLVEQEGKKGMKRQAGKMRKGGTP